MPAGGASDPCRSAFGAARWPAADMSGPETSSRRPLTGDATTSHHVGLACCFSRTRASSTPENSTRRAEPRMASGAKRKTTMAKRNREAALLERRARKQARKAARKQAAADAATSASSDVNSDDAQYGSR